MPLRLAIITSGKRTPLPAIGDGEPPIVPAENVVIEIEGDGVRSELLLNDEWKQVIRTDENRRGHLFVECFRSTGFHRIVIDDKTFCFGTADVKLELDGILAILKLIGPQGLSWGHQLIFSDGNAIRDPRVDFAWLRTAARKMLDACRAIIEKPATTTIKRARPTLPRGGRVVTGATLALLRSNPQAFLEEHEAGVIAVNGQRWMPRRVVAPTPATSVNVACNRRATRLLLDADDLVVSLCEDKTIDMPKRHGQWLQALHNEIADVLDDRPFRDLRQHGEQFPDAASREELEDTRYETTFQLYNELTYERAWRPGRKYSDRYAYVGKSDEIYQAFVAVLLAEAFGAPRVGPYLRSNLATPSFQSDTWSIYYDTAPPRPGYASWRDKSSRPATLTPDYCVIDRNGNRGVLGDAKYRANGKGQRMPSSALNDCQVYMQHFDCSAFVVFYPGPDFFLDEITGDGNTILEVSVTPIAGMSDWMRDEVRPRIEALLQPLGT